MSEGAPQPGPWLPPRAPGAEPAPRFDPGPDPLAVPPPAAPTAPAAPPAAPATAPRLAEPPPPAHAAVGPRAGRNDDALIALSCGIGGLVLFVLSGFGLVFILNLPCSILAWVFGLRARRRVDRGETTERRGMAVTAIVLGVIGVVLGVLAIIGWALALALSEEVRRELEKQIDESSAALRG